ncbi:hypothetical protein [Paenimyroides ceti]
MNLSKHRVFYRENTTIYDSKTLHAVIDENNEFSIDWSDRDLTTIEEEEIKDFLTEFHNENITNQRHDYTINPYTEYGVSEAMFY